MGKHEEEVVEKENTEDTDGGNKSLEIQDADKVPRPRLRGRSRGNIQRFNLKTRNDQKKKVIVEEEDRSSAISGGSRRKLGKFQEDNEIDTVGVSKKTMRGSGRLALKRGRISGRKRQREQVQAQTLMEEEESESTTAEAERITETSTSAVTTYTASTTVKTVQEVSTEYGRKIDAGANEDS